MFGGIDRERFTILESTPTNRLNTDRHHVSIGHHNPPADVSSLQVCRLLQACVHQIVSMKSQFYQYQALRMQAHMPLLMIHHSCLANGSILQCNSSYDYQRIFLPDFCKCGVGIISLRVRCDISIFPFGILSNLFWSYWGCEEKILGKQTSNVAFWEIPSSTEEVNSSNASFWEIPSCTEEVNSLSN